MLLYVSRGMDRKKVSVSEFSAQSFQVLFAGVYQYFLKQSKELILSEFFQMKVYIDFFQERFVSLSIHFCYAIFFSASEVEFELSLKQGSFPFDLLVTRLHLNFKV